MKTRKIALYGMLAALALILSWAESLVPPFFAVPGMKLGLTNIVVLTTLYLMDTKSAVLINFVRIALVAALFGSGVSFLYSLSGGLLSGAVMILLKKTGRFGIAGVSAAGGIAHNVGQILVAMAVLETASIGWYLMILWLTGLVSGVLVGLLGGVVTGRLEGFFASFKEQKT